ncbi:hypothetical protein [Simplicispira suum]|uniref:Uncharacterized protein n=1 Tax=Simplicispira suum TaxID=2109915 RepID=A0A2S0N4Q7_9BURK|nr:hypothetical protein [Simplicispira suum]AVO43138.1 hypothetical protein C6571_07785 [Simplicispira suum]MBW7832343.1 hypothetical protein [Simplicispira suum]MCB1979774.1 hypothetical protein [Burkholderiaceae bacterium]
MQPTALLASIALLAAAISAPVLAGDRDKRSDRQHASETRAADTGFDHRMKVVANDAAPDSPAYGWRYFTDPTDPRAVVISPQGDYYYSRGKGLRWIAAEQS